MRVVWLAAALLPVAAFFAGRSTRRPSPPPAAPRVVEVAPAAPRVVAPPAPDRPTVEARDVVDRALRARVWTDETARELRRRRLPLEADRELRLRLITAINRQELKVTADHPF